MTEKWTLIVHTRLLFALYVCSTGLVACSAYGPQSLAPGASALQVQAQMGRATATHPPLPDQPQVASRLEFARGPMGKHTYMLDFDAQGRLLGWQQVLTEVNFSKVVPGGSDAQVLALLGQPSNIRGVGWRGLRVWSYRYEVSFCQWFQVSIQAGKVVDAGYAPDPLCENAGNDIVEP